MSLRPSRGGAGGPSFFPLVASLLRPPGVDVSNPWFTEARVGRPNVVSMNFRIELCSYSVGSRWPCFAKGEITHVGTRKPRP